MKGRPKEPGVPRAQARLLREGHQQGLQGPGKLDVLGDAGAEVGPKAGGIVFQAQDKNLDLVPGVREKAEPKAKKKQGR